MDVLPMQQAKKEGLTYLERLLKKGEVHDDLLVLIKGAIKDQEFVKDSKTFGKEWISHVVLTHEVKQASKDLVIETCVNEPRVVQESLNVLSYFVTHPRTKEIMKVFMSQVMTNDRVLPAACATLSEGGFTSIQSAAFREQYFQSSMETISKERVSEGIKNELVYKPMKNVLTLGLYDWLFGSEEQTVEPSQSGSI